MSRGKTFVQGEPSFHTVQLSNDRTAVAVPKSKSFLRIGEKKAQLTWTLQIPVPKLRNLYFPAILTLHRLVLIPLPDTLQQPRAQKNMVHILD